jgi:hypothetical protein
VPDGRVFRPKGLTPSEEQVYVNTFGGFGFDPLPGDCDLFWQHVYDNIAHGDDQLMVWLRAWLAALIQHPEQRASVALVLKGERGTGKGEDGPRGSRTEPIGLGHAWSGGENPLRFGPVLEPGCWRGGCAVTNRDGPSGCR